MTMLFVAPESGGLPTDGAERSGEYVWYAFDTVAQVTWLNAAQGLSQSIITGVDGPIGIHLRLLAVYSGI